MMWGLVRPCSISTRAISNFPLGRYTVKGNLPTNPGIFVLCIDERGVPKFYGARDVSPVAAWSDSNKLACFLFNQLLQREQ